MNNKITWLRVACWSGAIVDGLAAILLTFPALNSWFTGAVLIGDSALFRIVNAQAAALMWGWTLLLVWAARSPLERRGVMVLSLFPVLSLLIVSRFVDVLVYQASLARNLPLFALQFSLLALFLFSLWTARGERSHANDGRNDR